MDDGSCVSGGESLTQCEEYHNEVATNTENIRLTLSNINKKLVCRRNVEKNQVRTFQQKLFKFSTY